MFFFSEFLDRKSRYECLGEVGKVGNLRIYNHIYIYVYCSPKSLKLLNFQGV